ncbi:hypothetical protein HID58_050706, partial [Brassica napus]
TSCYKCKMMWQMIFGLPAFQGRLGGQESEKRLRAYGRRLPLHTLNIIFVLLSGTFTVNGKVNPASEANKLSSEFFLGSKRKHGNGGEETHPDELGNEHTGKRAMVSRGEMTFQDVYGAEALLNEEDEEDDSGWNLSSRRYPLIHTDNKYMKYKGNLFYLGEQVVHVHQLDLMTNMLGIPSAEAIERNSKAGRYLRSIRKKKPIPFSHKFLHANPLAFCLQEKNVVF